MSVTRSNPSPRIKAIPRKVVAELYAALQDAEHQCKTGQPSQALMGFQNITARALVTLLASLTHAPRRKSIREEKPWQHP